MPGRYYIKTFGCQMNEYDSTRMGDVLEAGASLTRTSDPAEADVLLMNTCSVREKAEDKVYSLLGEWRALKKLKPHVLIGVGGCVASQEGDAITRSRQHGLGRHGHYRFVGDDEPGDGACVVEVLTVVDVNFSLSR